MLQNRVIFFKGHAAPISHQLHFHTEIVNQEIHGLHAATQIKLLAAPPYNSILRLPGVSCHFKGSFSPDGTLDFKQKPASFISFLQFLQRFTPHTRSAACRVYGKIIQQNKPSVKHGYGKPQECSLLALYGQYLIVSRFTSL